MKRSHFFTAISLLILLASGARAADLQPSKDAGPYVPSPASVVADMLRYAEVGPNDFLIDLGSGDGRIVLTAAKLFGARGVGVEIKESLVKRANEAALKEGLAERVKFVKQDLFKTDISKATVITMYLLPDTVNLLKDKLLTELRPGTRIVSHEDVKLRDDRLSFRLARRKGEFSGQVKGGSIEGTLDSGGTRSPWSATLSG